MPFRDVELPDGSTVRARVSEQAIADWLATRDVVRRQYGFDRPPDWDTGPSRGWLPHVSDPGEQERFGALTFGGKPLDRATAVSEQPAVTWVWDDTIVTKLILSQRGDGSFRVKWRAFPQHDVGSIMSAGQMLVDREWLSQPDVDADMFGDWLDSLLLQVDTLQDVAAKVVGKAIVARIELAHEQLDTSDVGDEAAADIIDEFGWAEWAEPFLGARPTVAETS